MKLTDSQRRLIVILATGWVLLWLSRQANHLLAPVGISLWLTSLLITLPALRLNFRTGLVGSFVLGLAMDAWSPVPFGTHAILLAFAHVVVFRIRNRIETTEVTIAVIVALITNLALFVALTMLILSHPGGVMVSSLRLLTDLVVSQITLALIAPWFFALQERGLELIFRVPWLTARTRIG